MTYNECLEYIYSFRKVQKSSSHERIENLLSLFGNPQKSLSFIHVAGTNGKGSVSGALSKIFSVAGYKTGLFTSPFVIEFGERIQIDGKYIDSESLCTITSEIREKTEKLTEKMKPTVFEFITLIAFIYFRRENCDIVILEAGIGGEHDSTNVIPAPLASVFVSVSLDHTEMLGSTVAEIAKEKSGIIKKGSSVISYPLAFENAIFKGQSEEAFDIFRKKAEEKGCEFFSPDINKLDIISQNLDGTAFTYKHLKLRTSLWGDHQVANMITAAECALVLKEKGERISDQDIEKGISSFFIPCRMERIKKDPTVILDGGHNEGCMRALRAVCEKYLKGKEITLLMASMKDKNYKKGLEIILPVCKNAVFTRTDKVRGESAKTLTECAKKAVSASFAEEDINAALKKALLITGKDGVLLCCGSFYLVSDIRKILLCD